MLNEAPEINDITYLISPPITDEALNDLYSDSTWPNHTTGSWKAELERAVVYVCAYSGCSGLHDPRWDVPRFETGYWVRTSFAGRGYITEAVRAIADFGFEVFGVKRVEILASTVNVRSCKVALAAGFVREGVLRNHERHLDGTLRDTAVFAKIAP